jgi:subtilisin family serine protease
MIMSIPLLTQKAYSKVLNGKLVRVAVIDTGIDFTKVKAKICKDGLIDLTRKGIKDTNGHGSNIVSIIADDLKDIPYCLIIFNYYIGGDESGNFLRSRAAFEWLAINPNKVDIINMSGGGYGSNYAEESSIKKLLDDGVVIVAAAGNNATNLDKSCDFYPACYDKRIIVVGNGEPEKNLLYKTSNYGKIVDVIVNGINICGGGSCLTGTSQSTARITNWAIKNYRRIENEQKVRREKRSSKRK